MGQPQGGAGPAGGAAPAAFRQPGGAGPDLRSGPPHAPHLHRRALDRRTPTTAVRARRARPGRRPRRARRGRPGGPGAPGGTGHDPGPADLGARGRAGGAARLRRDPAGRRRAPRDASWSRSSRSTNTQQQTSRTRRPMTRRPATGSDRVARPARPRTAAVEPSQCRGGSGLRGRATGRTCRGGRRRAPVGGPDRVRAARGRPRHLPVRDDSLGLCPPRLWPGVSLAWVPPGASSSAMAALTTRVSDGPVRRACVELAGAPHDQLAALQPGYRRSTAVKVIRAPRPLRRTVRR